MALPGFSKFFKNSSDEEREHAEKLMKYQNKRGGRIVLQDIKVLSAQWVYSGCVQLVHSHHFFMKLEKHLLYLKQINVCKMTCFDSLDKLLDL